MTASARPRGRDEAFRILQRVDASDAYASRLLQALPSTMDPRERALAQELVLGTLRWQGSLDHALAPISRRPLGELDEPVRIALRLGAYQILRLDRIPARAAVDESVRLAAAAGGQAAGGYVNGVLRSLCRSAPRPPAPEADLVTRLAVEHSHPRWLVARRVAQLGPDEAARALAADNRPAPTVLRANRARGDAASLQRRLDAEGTATEAGRWAVDALRVPGPLTCGASFAEGWYYVQDEASQLVADLVPLQPGERVADLCAAPGGKATALGARGASVIASDRHGRRLRLVRENADRLDLAGLRLVVQDAARPAIAPGSMDHVLLDAPCTGTGTLRRHPEIRWRRREEDIVLLAAAQRRLLRAAAPLVRPGGTLVYSVCSLEPEEGPEVVERFLGDHPGFAILDPGAACGRFPPEMIERSRPGPHMRSWPHRHDVDGFFAAILRRQR